MSKWVAAIFFMLLAASIFTGCGAKGPAEVTDGGGVISGGVVSGSDIAERDVGIGHIGQSYFENDDNWYDWQNGENEEYAALIQYHLDKKTKVREIKMEIDQVEWVTNDWLYYRTYEDGSLGNSILWRMPIQKTENGDRLLTGEKEKLLEGLDLWIDYATDSYLILGHYTDDSGQETEIYKYDLRTKKKKVLMKGKGDPGALELKGHYMDGQKVSAGQNYSFMIDGELIMESWDALYRLNPETEKVTAIFSKPKKSGCITYAFYQGEFYFECDNALYYYNRDTRKPECCISKKKMMETVGKLKSAEIKDLRLYEMVLYKDKMYLPFEVQWKKKDPDTGKETIYERDELYYVKMGQSDTLHCEDKLIDYLDKDGIFGKCQQERGGIYFDYAYEYEGFKNGEAVFAYMEYMEDEQYFDWSGYYVGYDIVTKKGEDLEENWELEEEE